MSILKKLLLKYNIQDSDVIDVSKPPNFREANHAKTSFDRAYYENVHQIDTLYLPTDKSGYKYLLVCIDIGSGLTDVRAMKNLNGETSLKCLKNIYGLDNKKQNDVFKKNAD